jgi:nucleoid DNA-binding protein
LVCKDQPRDPKDLQLYLPIELRPGSNAYFFDPGAHWVPPKTTEKAPLTVKKEAINRSVFDRSYLSKTASTKADEAAFKITKRTIEPGEDVLITSFGKLCIKLEGKRRGRNPHFTGYQRMSSPF